MKFSYLRNPKATISRCRSQIEKMKDDFEKNVSKQTNLLEYCFETFTHPNTILRRLICSPVNGVLLFSFGSVVKIRFHEYQLRQGQQFLLLHIFKQLHNVRSSLDMKSSLQEVTFANEMNFLDVKNENSDFLCRLSAYAAPAKVIIYHHHGIITYNTYYEDIRHLYLLRTEIRRYAYLLRNLGKEECVFQNSFRFNATLKQLLVIVEKHKMARNQYIIDHHRRTTTSYIKKYVLS